MSCSAVILAAGAGKRLGEIGKRHSKPMVPIDGRPLIDHVIDRLRAAGVDRLVVVAHADDQRLRRHLRRYAADVDVAVQAERRGIAEAVLIGARCLATDAYVACACDSLFEPGDIVHLIARGRAEPGAAAVGVLDMGEAATRSRSAVRLDGELVREIVEKPTTPLSGLVAMPLYWLTAELSLYLATAETHDGERHVTTALNAFIPSGGRVLAVPVRGRLEITTAEDVAGAEALLRSRK